MPVEVSRAAFLSYASQDAAAVACMTEALRAAGVEVWFDQNDLVGGDAWDAKIRKQIAECALFVPVISAATQARLEGYFRIEWKLAAQRTHAMAEEKAFLLPVVIDATRDLEAKVPGEFRAVQWTRLPDGEATPAFVARVKTLLGGEAGPNGLVVGARLVRAHRNGRGRATPQQRRRPPRVWGAGAFAIIVAIATALLVSKKSSAPAAAEAPAKPTPVASAPVAPAPSLDNKAVAVLPFANLSGDKDQEYFSDGLTEEILNALARERDLRVPGRTSSFSFKGKNASAAEIAKALGVSRLVEGSVQRSGTKVRIRVSLTRVADNASEELGTFTEEITDIFTLYDKVARAVVEKLTRRQLASSVEVLTKNSDAYNFYLRGRALQTRSAEYAGDATRLYEQAVASDPTFALAWARLAETRFRNYGGLTDRGADVVNGTREAIDQALSLQPNLTEALIMRANWVRNVERDLAAARRDLTRAEGLQAGTAELRKAQAYLEEETGNWPEASRFYREALSLDPQNGDSLNAIAIEYLVRGEFAEADRLFARAMSIQGPGFVIPFGNRVFLRLCWRGPEAALSVIGRAPAGQAGIAPWRAIELAELGRLREARAEIEVLAALPKDLSYQVIFLAEAVGLNDLARRWAEKLRADAEKEFSRGNRAPFVRLDAVNAEIVLGHSEKALALLEEWRREEQHGPSASRRMFLFSFWAAPAYGRLGRAAEAIAILREMETEGFNFNGYDLRCNLAYAPIRNDPHFQELMLRAEAWAKAQPDPMDP